MEGADFRDFLAHGATAIGELLADALWAAGDGGRVRVSRSVLEHTIEGACWLAYDVRTVIEAAAAAAEGHEVALVEDVPDSPVGRWLHLKGLIEVPKQNGESVASLALRLAIATRIQSLAREAA